MVGWFLFARASTWSYALAARAFVLLHLLTLALSVVVLLYLAYPTLVKQSMGALACEKVGDALWLAADLQEPCFVGAHLTVVLLVSLPQILLYTVGLPLAATIHLYRRRKRLGDKQVQFRWGLLYAGFRHKVWW